MPSLNDIYGGDFIKATKEGTIYCKEHPGQSRLVFTIKGPGHVHTFDNNDQQVKIGFRETDMTLGLNKTNAATIAEISGTDDYEGWDGVQIELSVIPQVKSPTGKSIMVGRVPNQNRGGANAPAPKVLGPAGAARLQDVLKEKSLMFTDLQKYLRTLGLNCASLSENWPAEWGTHIKTWMSDPKAAEAAAAGTPDTSDIPF